MIKSLIASGVVATASVLASPALAGSIFVNPEYNAGFSGAEFIGSSLELHAGFQEGPFYIQAGPALANDGSDSEWGLSGKAGVSASVSSKLDLYTEVGYSKFEDVDAGYALKLGSKYVF